MRSLLCGWEVRRGGVHFLSQTPQSKVSHVLVNFLEAAQFSLRRQAGALFLPSEQGSGEGLEMGWGDQQRLSPPHRAQERRRRAGALCGTELRAVHDPAPRAGLGITSCWTPPALAGSNPDLEAWSLLWDHFPKRLLRPRLGHPRLRRAGSGWAKQRSSGGVCAGSGPWLVPAGSKRADAASTGAECAGRPGMAGASRQEFLHLH